MKLKITVITVLKFNNGDITETSIFFKTVRYKTLASDKNKPDKITKVQLVGKVAPLTKAIIPENMALNKIIKNEYWKTFFS